MHSTEVKKLLTQLSGVPAFTRWSSARELTRHYLDEEASENIAGLMKRRNLDVRKGTEEAFWFWLALREGKHTSQCLAYLMRMLSDQEIAGSAAQHLVWHFVDKADWKRLKELLKDPHPHARTGALDALWNQATGQTVSKEDIRPVFDSIRNLLGDQDCLVRRKAGHMVAFLYVQEKKWQKVHELLRREDEAVKLGAARALAYSQCKYGINISPFLSQISPLFPQMGEVMRKELLVSASGQGNLDLVKALVEAGTDVNARVQTSVMEAKGEKFETPLMAAVMREKNMEVVRYLIERGAEPAIKPEILFVEFGDGGVDIRRTGKYESTVDLAKDAVVREYLMGILRVNKKAIPNQSSRGSVRRPHAQSTAAYALGSP